MNAKQNRPGIIIIERKEKESTLIDMGDRNISSDFLEKLSKCKETEKEIEKNSI